MLALSQLESGSVLASERASPNAPVNEKLNKLASLRMVTSIHWRLDVLGECSHAGLIDLGHALRVGWVEFWYQPKIDLRNKQIIGVEMFVRARHPFHGVLPAAVLLPGADEKSLAQLSTCAINSALQASRRLSRLDACLPITLNVPVATLHNLPAELILGRQPHGDGWPGLIFDIGEDDILSDIPALQRIAEELAECGMKLAVDGFGRNLCSLIQSVNSSAMQEQIVEVSRRLIELKTVSVSELKLDRTLVTNCASEPRQAALCKIVIDLIHHIGSRAVAVGLETAADVAALRDMGCDIGQGNYFCEPMPLEQFAALLKSRLNKQKPAAATYERRMEWFHLS
jgi:EAL domain-containing protein (putative c-di-GMP-specific phosphodiesterase class I)